MCIRDRCDRVADGGGSAWESGENPPFGRAAKAGAREGEIYSSFRAPGGEYRHGGKPVSYTHLFSVVILFSVYFYSLKMGDIRSIYMEVNGLWWENKNKAIVEAIANLILNFFLGKFFGVYGILFATIITIVVINFGYGSQIIFRCYFQKMKITEYYLKHLFYVVITVVASLTTIYVCVQIPVDGVIGLFIRGVVCCIIPNIIYLVFYHRTNEFKETIPLIKRIIWKNR